MLQGGQRLGDGLFDATNCGGVPETNAQRSSKPQRWSWSRSHPGSSGGCAALISTCRRATPVTAAGRASRGLTPSLQSRIFFRRHEIASGFCATVVVSELFSM